MTEPAEQDQPVASPRPALAAALFSGVGYIALTLFIYRVGYEVSYGGIIAMHVSFIAFAAVLTQLAVKKQLGARGGFVKLWLYGWMSVLVLALITAVFYRVFFAQTGEVPNIPNYFARMLMAYNFFGLVISAVVAFFTSRL